MGKVIDAAVLFLYPVIVYFGLTHLGIRWTALILLALTARRVIVSVLRNRDTSKIVLIQAVAMTAIIGTAAALESELALRVTPFIVSLTFIAMFAGSLRATPLIERFARLQKNDLSDGEVVYCRKLTRVWVWVLVVNSLLLLGAALVEDKEIWTILVGPISYGMLGFVFGVEYVYRKYRFQEFGNNPLDRILRAVVGRRESP